MINIDAIRLDQFKLVIEMIRRRKTHSLGRSVQFSDEPHIFTRRMLKDTYSCFAREAAKKFWGV
jgi:hypothetical protein